MKISANLKSWSVWSYYMRQFAVNSGSEYLCLIQQLLPWAMTLWSIIDSAPLKVGKDTNNNNYFVIPRTLYSWLTNYTKNLDYPGTETASTAEQRCSGRHTDASRCGFYVKCIVYSYVCKDVTSPIHKRSCTCSSVWHNARFSTTKGTTPFHMPGSGVPMATRPPSILDRFRHVTNAQRRRLTDPVLSSARYCVMYWRLSGLFFSIFGMIYCKGQTHWIWNQS